MNSGMSLFSDRDWLEDFEHENGQYQCICVMCGKSFIGHKRRTCCEICTPKQKIKQMTPSQEKVLAVLRLMREEWNFAEFRHGNTWVALEKNGKWTNSLSLDAFDL